MIPPSGIGDREKRFSLRLATKQKFSFWGVRWWIWWLVLRGGWGVGGPQRLLTLGSHWSVGLSGKDSEETEDVRQDMWTQTEGQTSHKNNTHTHTDTNGRRTHVHKHQSPAAAAE